MEFSNGELDPENHMASASIQKQVQTLKHWNSLVQEGAELEVNLNKDSKQTPLSYKVKSFIEDVANMGRTSQTRRSTPTTTMEGNNSDSLALFATFDQRKDLDFSDLFWDFAARKYSDAFTNRYSDDAGRGHKLKRPQGNHDSHR